MAVKRTQAFTNTDAFVAGGSISHEFAPIPYTITRVDFELTANVTTTAAPGTTQDWIWRLIRGLTLTTPLGNHIAVGDLRPLHFENKFRWPGKFHTGSAPGATQAGFVRRAYIRCDFGVNPADAFDTTGGIPAHTANLTLTGTWGTAANLGAGYTVNAGTVLTTKFYGILPESDNEAVPKGIPLISTAQPQPTANTASLGYNVNWPKAHYLHSMVIMPALGVYPADNRSDTAISDIGITLPIQASQQRYYSTWSFARQQEQDYSVRDDDGTTFGVPTIAPEAEVGVLYLPIYKLASGGSALYGADNRSASEGDTTTSFGIANSANLSLWTLYRQYDINPQAPGP